MCEVNNMYKCYKCETEIDWEEGHDVKGNIWDCEVCSANFCSECFLEETNRKRLPADDSLFIVRCPECHKRLEEMKGKIRELEYHHSSNDQYGKFVRLNLEGQFNFADFFAEGFGECDELSNIMSQFAFSTEVSQGHKHCFRNDMNLQVHQLSYGTVHYVQGDFEKLMYEMAGLENTQYTKDYLVEQFVNVIEMFNLIIGELELELEQDN